MDKLLDYICDELEELEHKADKGKLTMAELQYVDTLAHAKKNLLTADAMMDAEYDHSHGISYARGAKRDSMGRYSSEGYSRTGEMADRLRELVNEAPDDRTRQEIQRLADRMAQM